ncbi:MAG TPA: YhcN/YlaJ family sporulation lipoprotein [Clostridia bacterium]|nr:YhcN/YlaJ family sporulation lipoprotein [Clostridia bacterium]
MKNRIRVLLSVLLLISTIALFGCTTNRRPITPAPGQTRTVPGPTRVTPPTTPAPGIQRPVPAPTRVTPRTTNPNDPGTVTPGTNGIMTPGGPGTMTPGTPRTTTPGPTTPGTVRRPSTTNTAGDRAKAIARDVAKEKNIQSASCVVTGDTALVGLQFEKQYKGKVTDAIKKSVDRRVKKLESTIKKVVVTADPDLLSRIKTMAKDIEGGKPLSGFTNEIEEIVRRINPF